MSGNKEYKRLLIVTGPQGSGNHLFSKVLGYHPYVNGWDFGDKYWIPSDEEPFAECWVDPSKTKSMLKGSAIVANVSVPFVYDGVKQVPKIQEVVNEAKNAGYDVKVCVVVREENINKEQQRRDCTTILLQSRCRPTLSIARVTLSLWRCIPEVVVKGSRLPNCIR